MAGNPPGFDPTTFRDGILQAMLIGEPPKDEDKPKFVVPGSGDPVYTRGGVTLDPASVRLDPNGRPLDPTIKMVRPGPTQVYVPVAVEFSTAEANELPVGNFRPTKATITILDQDTSGTLLFDQVKDATDVILGGDSYQIAYRPPPYGMGTVTIYQMVAFARQET